MTSRAILRVTPAVLSRALGLPDGYTAIAVRQPWEADAFEVLVSCPDGGDPALAPFLAPFFNTRELKRLNEAIISDADGMTKFDGRGMAHHIQAVNVDALPAWAPKREGEA